MSRNEVDARRMAEQLKKLPEDVQERVGYIIQGTLLVSENCIGSGSQTVEDQSSA